MSVTHRPVRLSQTAPWNPALRNGYRERYAQVGERYFKVSANSLDAMWWVEEIHADGDPFMSGLEYVSPCGWAFRLSEARAMIERFAAEPQPEHDPPLG